MEKQQFISVLFLFLQFTENFSFFSVQPQLSQTKPSDEMYYTSFKLCLFSH